MKNTLAYGPFCKTRLVYFKTHQNHPLQYIWYFNIYQDILLLTLQGYSSTGQLQIPTPYGALQDSNLQPV